MGMTATSAMTPVAPAPWGGPSAPTPRLAAKPCLGPGLSGPRALSFSGPRGARTAISNWLR